MFAQLQVCFATFRNKSSIILTAPFIQVETIHIFEINVGCGMFESITGSVQCD